MITATGSQLSTSSWATIDDVSLDTTIGSEVRMVWYFSATTNDVLVKVQGSVNGDNWIDLNTRDMNSSDVQDVEINVESGASAVAIISPEDRDGMNSGFAEYRVQIKGSSPYGTVAVAVVAK